jgi:prepilin-type N-terminal cleavage/methylation domain-containing protein
MATARRGFTLIELLTVIAIIALLAAILFPVFARVMENRRFASCMSNMHALYVAANLYYQDKGEYPELLLGPAERPDGLPYLAGGPGPVPMGQIRRGFLYPNYVKDIEKFRCPNNPARNNSLAVTAAYPPASAWGTVVAGGVPTFTKGGMKFSLPAAYDNQPVTFYAADCYDITASVDANGRRVASAGTAPGFFVAYSKNWTAARDRGVDPRNDASNQLMYGRTMPPDRTVLMMCNYHVVSGGGDKCPVIFANGSAKPLDYKQVLQYGYNVGNQ